MQNSALKAQLEGLRDIGLDRVNVAVAAVFEYVAELEAGLKMVGVPWDQITVDNLTEQNTLLRAELAAVRNALEAPTPADSTPPSANPGFAGDPPHSSAGAP